jgi:peptide/nickel transport system permease protein
MRKGFFARLSRNRLAGASAIILAILYLVMIFSGFFEPENPATQSRYSYLPPTPIHFFFQGHLVAPYVEGLKQTRNPITFALEYTPDPKEHYRIHFFVHSWRYRILGLFPSTLHLFGSRGPLYLFGTDELGRDLFSRTLAGSIVSLTIGLVVVAFTFPVGVLIGGLSGYLGGWVDFLIQRILEILLSIPTLPLLLALSMLVPANTPPLVSFLEIAGILAALGWTGLARIVRGQVLGMRELDYVVASQAAGSSRLRILFRHIAPNLASYLIVSATLSIPGYILAESALSFLGLGIRPPMTSWGLLLSAALGSNSLLLHPWILIPGGFIALTVLCFNFLGDGLRDVVDPYRRSG